MRRTLNDFFEFQVWAEFQRAAPAGLQRVEVLCGFVTISGSSCPQLAKNDFETAVVLKLRPAAYGRAAAVRPRQVQWPGASVRARAGRDRARAAVRRVRCAVAVIVRASSCP